MKKAKRGRPAGRKKSAALGVRIAPDVRDHLVQAAAASGRTLSKEVELRLGQSTSQLTEIYAAFGGPDKYAVMMALAKAISTIEIAQGPSMLDSLECFGHVEVALPKLLRVFKPTAKGRRWKNPSSWTDFRAITGALREVPCMDYYVKAASANLARAHLLMERHDAAKGGKP